MQLKDTIIQEVSTQSEISVENILSKKRSRRISKARNLCMHIIRIACDYSTIEVAMVFKCDHSSVIHATKRYHAGELDGILPKDYLNTLLTK